MPVYKRTLDALGRPTGTVEYSLGRSPRSRPGCLGWFTRVLLLSLFVLWPVSIVGKSPAGTAISVGYWLLLTGLLGWLLVVTIRGVRRAQNKQHVTKAPEPSASPPPEGTLPAKSSETQV